MLNQIMFYCLAISKRVALQLPFAATTTVKRIYVLIRSNILILLLAWAYWYPLGERGSAPTVSCRQNARLSIRLLSKMETLTADTIARNLQVLPHA